MKGNYWAPRNTSSWALLAIAAASLGGIGAVEALKTEPARPYREEKLAAAHLARRAMDEIKAVRMERGLKIDAATDISQSGMIGCAMSPVTSVTGALPAKQTSVNPNFAAVVVEMLRQAGVQEGDTVAVGFSGSFPALNVCVLAAAETLGLEPVIISSASASQWGANEPELLWIDMERELCERGIFRWRSVAASLGGIEDCGVGLSDEGCALLAQAIEQNGLPLIDAKDYLDSINRRMALYRRHAGAKAISAYVNVGGGTVSVGTQRGKELFAPGLNVHRPLAPLPTDSIMGRLMNEDVPVIHLSDINHLAAVYALPIQPAAVPAVGEGDVYFPRTYNKWLAGGLLAALVASLAGVARGQPSALRVAKLS